MAVAGRLMGLGARVPGTLPGDVSVTPDRSGPCPGEWVRAGRGLRESALGSAGAGLDGSLAAGLGDRPREGSDGGLDGDLDGDLHGDLDEDKVALYFHGGAYFVCSPATHRPITWRLSAAAGRPVFAADYRQGPPHSLGESLADALGAYEGLLDRGYRSRDILVAGDSAGGHLTLALLLTLRDRGLPLPGSAICLSPWTDLSGPRRRARFWADPMLPAGRVEWLARRWTDGLDPCDPLVSPVYGDYTGVPPLMIVTGSTELLRDDGRRVATSARENGVPVTYEEWRRMPHVFAILADVLPEARLLFGHIRRFLAAVEAHAAKPGADAA
ncbi:alpha/beta hydrolase [Microbispora sp. RL4-1S]|uniref:Alpha/beta hydrolase n=2 Tax=Microbispora oryzae TaxID=2806554 RepID=A0A940WDW3_9ACTN|nr:alpha/beta hydrolase [Microbispora oryzae]